MKEFVASPAEISTRFFCIRKAKQNIWRKIESPIAIMAIFNATCVVLDMEAQCLLRMLSAMEYTTRNSKLQAENVWRAQMTSLQFLCVTTGGSDSLSLSSERAKSSSRPCLVSSESAVEAQGWDNRMRSSNCTIKNHKRRPKDYRGVDNLEPGDGFLICLSCLLEAVSGGIFAKCHVCSGAPCAISSRGF